MKTPALLLAAAASPWLAAADVRELRFTEKTHRLPPLLLSTGPAAFGPARMEVHTQPFAPTDLIGRSSDREKLIRDFNARMQADEKRCPPPPLARPDALKAP